MVLYEKLMLSVGGIWSSGVIISEVAFNCPTTLPVPEICEVLVKFTLLNVQQLLNRELTSACDSKF
jgi:hypothetical protein